jgi:hypothetical protein
MFSITERSLVRVRSASIVSAPTEHNKGRFAWLLLIPLLLLACGQLLWVTVFGPGVHEDSYVYMATASALFHGYGFQYDGKPMTHFAPAYSALLAATYLVTDNLAHAARWLHVVLYSINIVLVSVAAYIVSERSILATVIAPLAVLLSGELLVIYSTAASESPFLAVALTSFILLSMHITAPRWGLLVSAAVCLGVAMALRYVGITLLAAALVGFWFMDRRPPARRMLECVFLAFASSLLLGAWLIRNLILTAAPTSRTLAFHPVGLDQLKVLVINLCNFYLPLEINAWLKLAILMAVAAMVLVQFYRVRFSPAGKTLVSLLVVFCGIYIGFLLFSMSFIDALTDFEYRILAPVGVFSFVVTIPLCLKVATAADRTWIRWLSGAFVVSVLLGNAAEMWRIATDLHHNGYYYSARKWRESESLAFVRSIPQTVTLYSNEPAPIGYLLGRRARMLPPKISPTSLIPVADFTQSMRPICDDVIHNSALIVFFNYKRWYLPTAQEVQSACGFAISRLLADGFVFEGK